jgi:hypothetical protein
MGSTTITTNGAFFTYCGTNNVVYGQYFYGTGPQAQHALGGSCAIYTSSSGYINGGVDVTYDSSLSAFRYIFPNSSNRDLTVDLYY